MTGNEIRYISGRTVTQENIYQALLLDRIAYDEIFYLDLPTCLDYFQKNHQIYFMALDTAENVIGYINFSPVTYEMYQKIKSGNVVDTTIRANDIVAYSSNQQLWGYFSSIVVHPSFRRHGIGTELIRNVLSFLIEKAKKDRIFFNGIVADAVSADGERFLNRVGFDKELLSNHCSKIMSFTPESSSCRVTELNHKLIKTYKETC